MWQSEDILGANQNDGQNPRPPKPDLPAARITLQLRLRARPHRSSATQQRHPQALLGKSIDRLAWPAPWDGRSQAGADGGLIGSLPTGAIPGRGSAVFEFAWSPPNPANYSSFGGDQNHFCLLARIETAAAAGGPSG